MASLSAELRERIEKLAQYVSQSNGAMEDTVRERQRTNPNFAFLFGGEGAGYYQECVRNFARGQGCGGGPGSMGFGGGHDRLRVALACTFACGE